jgi:hypothetical protein
MDDLFRRDWPGNIRELRNAVHRAMVLATGELVERRDVLAALPGAVSSPSAPLVRPAEALPVDNQPPARPEAAVAAGATDRAGSEPFGAVAPASPAPGSVPVPVPAVPATPPTEPQVVLQSLPPRVRALYDLLVAQGSVGTQDHMQSAGVSHRTGLRDLQLLVELGLAQRVGTRRGARYRPTNGQTPMADS